MNETEMKREYEKSEIQRLKRLKFITSLVLIITIFVVAVGLCSIYL